MTYSLPKTPLIIPPGMYLNGTAYQRSRRWVKGNLIRFYKGSVTPIGGWSRARDISGNVEIAALYADPTTEAARNCYAWRANSGDTYVAIGTNKHLFVISPDGTVTDATPVGFTTFDKDGGYTSSGFGDGFYGQGYPYGRPPAVITDPFVTDYIPTWRFDNWGEDLIATVSANNQDIYSWSPGDGAAVAIPNAPDDSRDAIVTDQRILMSIGDSANIRLVEWSDSEDRENWTPAVNNQAGNLTLPGKGRLIRALNIGKDVLLLGEQDVYLLRYLGPPYIFGQGRLFSDTSLIGPNAAVQAGDYVIWWGDQNFWIYSAGTVQMLPCDVIDYLNYHMDPLYKSKTQASVLSQYNEIWFHYQSVLSSTGEPDSYVIYNFEEKHWTVGKIDRTCGVDRTLYNYPVKVSSDGLVYYHEQFGVLSDGPNTFIESGTFELAENAEMYIGRMYCDIEQLAIEDGSFEASSMQYKPTTIARPMYLDIIMQDAPNSVEIPYGPYEIDNIMPVRARGKFGKFRIYSDEDSDAWKVGIFQVEDMANGGHRGRT